MPLSRSFKTTVMERMKNDSVFGPAMLAEAMEEFLNGNPKTALRMLRDVVNGSIGFPELAVRSGIPRTSLMRMLGNGGNPSISSITRIIPVLTGYFSVTLKAEAAPFVVSRRGWTDYPIMELGDIEGQIAPVREVEVFHYDGDKYAYVVVGGHRTSFKRGYIYSEPGRLGEVPNLSMRGLSPPQEAW